MGIPKRDLIANYRVGFELNVVVFFRFVCRTTRLISQYYCNYVELLGFKLLSVFLNGLIEPFINSKPAGN